MCGNSCEVRHCSAASVSLQTVWQVSCTADQCYWRCSRSVQYESRRSVLQQLQGWTARHRRSSVSTQHRLWYVLALITENKEYKIMRERSCEIRSEFHRWSNSSVTCAFNGPKSTFKNFGNVTECCMLIREQQFNDAFWDSYFAAT